MLQEEVQAFRVKVNEKLNNPNIDHSRPYKKSKRLEIRVFERENGTADVALLYDKRYSRMFGQHDTIIHWVSRDAEMKDACHAARELKKLLPMFKIVFIEYEEIDLF